MKKLVVGFALVLTACERPDDTLAALHRSQVVRFCADGTAIGRDPVDGRLVWMKDGTWTSNYGRIAPNVTPDQVCARGDHP